MADYVMTVDSDTEEPLNASKGPTDDLNPEFVFDLTGDAYNELLDGTGEPQDEIKIGSKPVCLESTGLCYYSNLISGAHFCGRYHCTS